MNFKKNNTYLFCFENKSEILNILHMIFSHSLAVTCFTDGNLGNQRKRLSHREQRLQKFGRRTKWAK